MFHEPHVTLAYSYQALTVVFHSFHFYASSSALSSHFKAAQTFNTHEQRNWKL